jgi:hypothetical protein
VFLREHICGFAQTFPQERVSESSQKLESAQAPWHKRLRVPVPKYRQVGVAKEPRRKRALEVYRFETAALRESWELSNWIFSRQRTCGPIYLGRWTAEGGCPHMGYFAIHVGTLFAIRLQIF